MGARRKRSPSSGPRSSWRRTTVAFATTWRQRTRRRNLAIAEYREAIRLDAQHASAWVNLGTALAEQGQRDEAAAAFRAVLRFDPTNTGARENLQLLLSPRAPR